MSNVSVVVVNYNSGNFLETCLTALCESDYPIEIIVVDNASTDESIRFLEGSPQLIIDVRLVKNNHNVGYAAAINQGAACSTSQNILILNPDCLVYPHTVRVLFEAVEHNHSVGIVGGLVFSFDGSEQKGCRRNEPTVGRSLGKVFPTQVLVQRFGEIDLNGEPLPDKEIFVDAVSGSFLLIRREVFVAVNGMDESYFLHFEDFDLCKRVRDAGWKILFLPHTSIFHYQGGSCGNLDYFVSKQKHRSMWIYQSKHHRRNWTLSRLLFIAIWMHFIIEILLQKVTRNSSGPPERNDASLERYGLPWIAISCKKNRTKRLLIIGPINNNAIKVINYGGTNGWSFYSTSTMSIDAALTSVYSVDPEYLEKAPVGEIPSFPALLITSSTFDSVKVEQIVSKCGIRKVAIIESFERYDRAQLNDNDAKIVQPYDNKSLDQFIKAMKHSEARLLPIALSKKDHLSHFVTEAQENEIKQCFSWFSA